MLLIFITACSNSQLRFNVPILVCVQGHGRAGLMRMTRGNFCAQWAEPGLGKKMVVMCLGINSGEPVCGLAGQVRCISPSHPHQSCNIQSYKKRDPASQACDEDLGRRRQYCNMSVQVSNSGVRIYFVINDRFKRVVPPRPTFAWPGRAWAHAGFAQ